MRASIFYIALLGTMLAQTAVADGTPRAKSDYSARRAPIVAKESQSHAREISWLVPDCRENWRPRLLSCAPRLYLRYDERTAVVLDGPPVRRAKPYPELFGWPYGAR